LRPSCRPAALFLIRQHAWLVSLQRLADAKVDKRHLEHNERDLKHDKRDLKHAKSERDIRHEKRDFRQRSASSKIDDRWHEERHGEGRDVVEGAGEGGGEWESIGGIDELEAEMALVYLSIYLYIQKYR
jgi:hypothetical protein